jgi:pimeloyl-ACP methyl ester carboxylesterase
MAGRLTCSGLDHAMADSRFLGGIVFADSRGFRIRYQVWGSGPALVLLHGFLMWGDRWRDTGYVSALENRFQVIVPDLLGHGESDKPHQPAAYGMANMASDVIAVLDAADADRAHVWGYSMGTSVAENLAVTVPGRVQSLLLGGFPPGLDGGERRAVTWPQLPQTWEEMLEGWPQPVADMFKAHNDFPAVQACLAALADSPTTITDLQAAPHPTLAYIGADDELADLTRQQCDALPCRLEVVPGEHVQAFRQAENVLPFAIGHRNASAAPLP